MVTATLRISVPKYQEHSREVWRFNTADWGRLETDLERHDWTSLQHAPPSNGAHLLPDCARSRTRANPC